MSTPPSFNAPSHLPLPPPQFMPSSAGWVPPTGPPAPPHHPFALRSYGGWAMLAGAVFVGIAFDVAAHNGLATIAGVALVWVAVAVLLLIERELGWVSRGAIVAAGLLSLALAIRSSPSVVTPVTWAVVLLLLLGASYGPSRSASATFPALGARLGVVGGHVMLAPGVVRPEEGEREQHANIRRGLALLRGLLLALPVVLVIGGLLGAADPVFQSWFNLPLMIQHLILVAIGAWCVLGLFRAARANEPVPSLDPAPHLGTVEAASVLGALCALYGAFVAAQLVAITGGDHHVLATRGLTYAEYARQGFFQLLAAAGLTLVVLLVLRACTDRANAAFVILAEVAVFLTLVVVAVALRRLALYESAYGLTILRLGSTAAALWIGFVFVLLAVAIARRHASAGWLAPAVALSAVVFVAGWAAANPAAIVARVNVDRAAHGLRFDVDQAVALGADSVPALTAKLNSLPPFERAALRRSLCGTSVRRADAAAYNRSERIAARSLDMVCNGR